MISNQSMNICWRQQPASSIFLGAIITLFEKQDSTVIKETSCQTEDEACQQESALPMSLSKALIPYPLGPPYEVGARETVNKGDLCG